MRTLTRLGMVAITTTGLLACEVNWTIDPTAESFQGKGDTGTSSNGGAGGNDPCMGPSGCGGDPACGKCPGAPCIQGTECASGFCVDGVCCDTACDSKCEACVQSLTGTPDGACAALPFGIEDPDAPACAGKGGCGALPGWCACEDGQQNGTETDVDCGGACGGTCTIGQACSTTADCSGALNECADGVCCRTACGGQCASCNLPGREGLCSPLAGNDAIGMCTGAEACNAEFGCKFADGEACSASIQCASGLCAGSPLNCIPCDAGNPCGAKQTCIDGICVETGRPVGLGCTADAMCTSGHCVDGFCCDTPCNGLCMGCSVYYTGHSEGTCVPLLPGYDPHDECTGPGKATTCSGQSPDPNGNSSCGSN